MKPYLTYYNKYQIIPAVKKNKKNFNTLTKQRNNLFEQLKIDRRLFHNSTVLEVGPGTGYNANYLINIGIKKITLVDGNIASINSIKKTLKGIKKAKFSIIHSDFDQLKLNKKFDFVICENVISGVKKPDQFLKKLSSFVSSDGYLITNCSDSISLFSEKIRGIISYLLLDEKKSKNLSFKKKTEYLSKVFKPHLISLGKNTRNIDDWVQDVLLYEYWWRKKSYFSLSSAIKSTKEKFNFYSSSPFCFSNYAWYKKLNFNINNSTINEFHRVQQNFFDNRTFNTLFSKKQNIKLNNLITKASDIIYSFDKNNLNNLVSILIKIKIFFLNNKKNDLTVHSLQQAISILKEFKAGKEIDKKKIKKMKSWWGYATQYVVLKKK